MPPEIMWTDRLELRLSRIEARLDEIEAQLGRPSEDLQEQVRQALELLAQPDAGG